MEAWKMVESYVEIAMEKLAKSLNASVENGQIILQSHDGRTTVSLTLSFYMNADQGKVWGVHSLRRESLGVVVDINLYTDHIDLGARPEEIFEMFMDWYEASRETVREYQDEVHAYGYLPYA